MDKMEIRKDLYRNKGMASFSHYVAGNLYYTVELSDGTYQFPISTVERKGLEGSYEEGIKENIKLSDDLGTTPFYNEVRGSELFRWINMAIDSEEFLKL